MDKKNVIWHDGYVERQERNRYFNHKSGLLLLTGLSASGKSTIAHYIERELFNQNAHVYVLDGDNIRHGLNSNLSFSREDRRENLRRIVEVSKLFVDAGMLVLAAFIFPYREDREYMRKRFEGDNFLEIYVKCPIEICEMRDPKGQYKKARAGIIKGYTGIDSPYDEPKKPDLIIDTEKTDIKNAGQMVIQLLNDRKYLSLD
ncbi:MAG: adenylyl-sulfate kinase [Nitrospirae bacterium]|nr:adenylyl-sulfate kinase [Nitrospirota bacterium]